MRVIVYAGSLKERKTLEKKGFRGANVVLTTYSILERPDGSSALSQHSWKVCRRLTCVQCTQDHVCSCQVIVLDEAHALKNSASARYATVLKLRVRHLIRGL